MANRDQPPIPAALMPKAIGRDPFSQIEPEHDPLGQLEAEIANVVREKQPEETSLMQDRPNPVPYGAPTRPEPAPIRTDPQPTPRPVTAPPPYTPAPESPFDIQFNSTKLTVKATVVTKADAELLIGSLTALVPFLNKNGESHQ